MPWYVDGDNDFDEFSVPVLTPLFLLLPKTEDESRLVLSGMHSNSSDGDDENDDVRVELPINSCEVTDLSKPVAFARTDTDRSLYEV